MVFNGCIQTRSYQLVILFFCLVNRTPISLANSINFPAVSSDKPSCGDGSDLEYPFVISPDPFHPGFQVYCDLEQNNTAKITIGGANLPLLGISREKGYIRVLVGATSWRCDGPSSVNEFRAPRQTDFSLEGTPFTYSQELNKFTVIGCDSVVLLNNGSIGCLALCPGRNKAAHENCMGAGCCQSTIPSGLKSFDVTFISINNLTELMFGISGCTKSLVVETESFQLRSSYFEEGANSPSYWPVVLDWSIGTETCAKARNESGYACKDNSSCYDVPSGIGYRCNCNHGYVGNPYVPYGCQDINECTTDNKCSHGCVNTVNKPGTYECHCPPGTHGDGLKAGSGCESSSSGRPSVRVVLVIGLHLLVVFSITGVLACWVSMNRKATKIRKKYVIKNGGMLLQQHISPRQPGPKIFSIKELMKATNSFSSDRVIGKGGYGTVYKGIFPNGEIVAIKKSKHVDETQIDQFINEVVILSKIIHKNVVKLLGCCLEDQIPLLVYEFIPNETLFHHLHENRTPNLSWVKRLTIATETAGAIAYLHYKTVVPIIHRDIKSANILLDNNYNAKVSDFGASRLIGFNQTHITTVVQGTFGYLNPEYFHTSQLTEKSDVYSFGVVLMEILTGEMPISLWKCEMERNLAFHFVSSSEEGRILDLIDRELVDQVDKMYIFAMADIASRCVRVKAEERPTMWEVAVELDALRRLMEKELKLEKPSEEDISSTKALNICRDNLNSELSPEMSLLYSMDIHEET